MARGSDGASEREPGAGDGSNRHPSGLHPPGASRRRRNRWVVVGLIAVSLSLLTSMLAFGLGRDPSTFQPVLVGRPAPTFSLRSLDGARTVGLADLHGQVVVLNFWASWCAECVVEEPALVQTWQRYRDRGVVVLGVTFEDSAAAATAFAKRFGADYPLLADPGSRTALDYGVTGIPETFLIAPNGRIAGKLTGPGEVTYEVLSQEIEALLPRGSP